MVPAGSIDILAISEIGDSFKAECIELISPYYVDPKTPLAYAIEHEATHVYFSRRVDGRLSGIFFARLPEPTLDIGPMVGYMGLTANAVTGIDGGFSRHLWKAYLRHSREEGSKNPLLTWYRTASPFGLYPCHHLLLNGEPRLDGSYSRKGAATMLRLREIYGLPLEDGEHPFVVRRYASARYSAFEVARSAKFGSSEAARLFVKLGINEKSGDRLLMLGNIP
jgi:hypothetical protein